MASAMNVLSPISNIPGVGDFLSSLFGGQNKTLNTDINQFGQDAGVAGGIGNADATAASKFYTDILSGDPTKQAQAIAPQTAAAQEGAQQQKNQAAQFAPRSGGMAAAMSGLDENTRSQLIKLLGGLQTSAASGAAGLGTAEQGLSQQATGQQAQLSQEQLMNFLNSVMGRGVAGLEEAGVNAGMKGLGIIAGKIPGLSAVL